MELPLPDFGTQAQAVSRVSCFPFSLAHPPPLLVSRQTLASPFPFFPFSSIVLPLISFCFFPLGRFLTVHAGVHAGGQWNTPTPFSGPYRRPPPPDASIRSPKLKNTRKRIKENNRNTACGRPCKYLAPPPPTLPRPFHPVGHLSPTNLAPTANHDTDAQGTAQTLNSSPKRGPQEPPIQTRTSDQTVQHTQRHSPLVDPITSPTLQRCSQSSFSICIILFHHGA